MFINENKNNGVIYLILTDKGFNKMNAFQTLDKIKDQFDRFFTDDQIKAAKPYGLNNEFRGYLERAWVKITDLTAHI